MFVVFPAELAKLEAAQVVQLLKTSHILLFDDVASKCVHHLLDVSDNCSVLDWLAIVKVCSELGLDGLRAKCVLRWVPCFDELPLESAAQLGRIKMGNLWGGR